MEIGQLEDFGFARAVVNNWSSHGTQQLMPLQERVVRETALLGGRNLMVFAPTSSGKTFLAELAAMRHIEAGRKSVFLVPTKALAEEQYAHLTAVYEQLGLRIAVATRERTAHDAAILAGHYDFAVMVYEKLKSFVTLRPAMLQSIGLVSVDELQIVGDPERGAVVDMLLARLVRTTPPVQLLCLSAVLAEGVRLATWLNCELYVWRERPVELREGVLLFPDGIFAYREHNSRLESCEQLLPASDPIDSCGTGDGRLTGVEAVARELAARGEQLLVFVPTRHMSREWAFHLAGALELPPCADAAAELDCQEPSHSRSLLEQSLERGTAFHNSDLPAGLRAAIETAFKAGHLRVLVATATLAQGVNLTARNVISEPVMAVAGQAPGAALMAPLSRQLFRNQGGRAGRFVAGAADFGRSILLAGSEEEARHLMREYVLREVDELDAPIRRQAFAQAVLDLVHTAKAKTPDELCDALLGTYTGMCDWAAAVPALRSSVESALDQLADMRLVRRGKGSYLPTRLGRAAAAYGIEMETAALFAAFAAACPEADAVPFAILAVCAFSPDGAAFPLNATRGELAVRKYTSLLSARDDIESIMVLAPLQCLLAPAAGFAEADHAALKKAFLAEAWISDHATHDIEEEFGVFAGTAANLAAHLAWLCQALAACVTAAGGPESARLAVAEIAERLPDGVPACGLELARLGVRGLARGHIAALVREGYGTRDAVLSAEAPDLERIVPAPVANRVVQTVRALTRKRRYSQTDLFGLPDGG